MATRVILCLVLIACIHLRVTSGRSGTRSRQGKIVGGEIVNIEQAPFHVALEYLTRQICGGAVLAPRWVVTAAHCFGRVFLLSQAVVRAGSGVRLAGGSEHAVRRLLTHPQFVLKVNDNDIALLEVHPSMEFSSAIAPIQLPEYYHKPQEGTLMTVYGFGYTKESGDPSYYLRAVQLPVFSHEECTELYKSTLNVTSQMLCAGFRDGGRDACVLDSGGPLVRQGVLQGVVSWGYGCARELHPGVFTDLTAPPVREWIRDNIQN